MNQSQFTDPPRRQAVTETGCQPFPETALNCLITLATIRDDNGQVIDFRVLDATSNVESALFVKPNELIGKRLLELWPRSVEIGLFAMYTRVVETGESEQTLHRYIDVAVPETWLELSVVRQGPDRLVLLLINCTASKQAERQLAQQAELLQTVLDNAQAAISLHAAMRGKDGQIENFRTVLANQQCIAMWGELADAILTKTFFEVTTPAQQIDEFARYVRVVETGETDRSELIIGDQWWLRITAKAGDGVVIANVDVSESRRYQQQLEAANLELKRSNESLQSFAYIASHDLQEPLRKIQSFGDMLQNRYASMLGAEGGELITRMQASAERMSILIRDLLDYSQLSSQRHAFRLFSLGKLIDDIVEDLWHPIQETNARLDISELPDLMGDRHQVRQLFQNILSNALKFRRVDGAGNPVPPVVRLSSRLTVFDELPADLQADLPINRSYWAICVADNGIGFDQQYAEQIFQVFQRLHNRQQFSGTGIGLAIVKRVAEQHDGTIRVTSRLGEGAAFTVYLPA
ncbi:ATP-binding protein [Spirosoma sp. RP8]|uniref:histidine kinase n=1 Tax=Spirosoma liriopis TaxID=2937440 RepID=A0ABT0HDY1_9BACT|nr:ATP-binding protein [Spirosoma liriopis]MCK8490365.1 ATP-binding protein [Spirosoma liriopis]